MVMYVFLLVQLFNSLLDLGKTYQSGNHLISKVAGN